MQVIFIKCYSQCFISFRELEEVPLSGKKSQNENDAGSVNYFSLVCFHVQIIINISSSMRTRNVIYKHSPYFSIAMPQNGTCSSFSSALFLHASKPLYFPHLSLATVNLRHYWSIERLESAPQHLSQFFQYLVVGRYCK